MTEGWRFQPMDESIFELALRSAEEEREALEEVAIALSHYCFLEDEFSSYLHDESNFLSYLTVCLHQLFNMPQFNADRGFGRLREQITETVDELRARHASLVRPRRGVGSRMIGLDDCITLLKESRTARGCKCRNINLSITVADDVKRVLVPAGLYCRVLSILLLMASEVLGASDERRIRIVVRASGSWLTSVIRFRSHTPPTVSSMGAGFAGLTGGGDKIPSWAVFLLVKRLLERIEGEVTVECGLDNLVVFSVRTPLRRRSASNETDSLDR
jgi:hypothetical protein